jgi:hypothetical protein
VVHCRDALVHGKVTQKRDERRGEPPMIDRKLMVKLLCVGLVAAVMLPAGSLLFPHVSDALSGVQFHALEAVLSTTLGFGLSALLG